MIKTCNGCAAFISGSNGKLSSCQLEEKIKITKTFTDKKLGYDRYPIGYAPVSGKCLKPKTIKALCKIK